MYKFIFVTGGVVSGLGKGITAASLGRLLKARGLKISAQKLDPYLNIDPGTMSPFQHGEVFVTEDGVETDLDLGHYERFIDLNLNRYSNLTSGRVYWNVLNKERNGDYLGETVQIIPHVTNEIKEYIYNNFNESNADIGIVEIGGTVGDIESQPFLEAIRQLSLEVGRRNCLFIHVGLVPYISGSNEFKSKPVQHSVKELMAVGIHPDLIVTRSDVEITPEIKNKISLFCNVPVDCVISNTTLPSLYEVPMMLYEQKMDEVVCRELGIENTKSDLSEWNKTINKIHNRTGCITIGIIGKYVKLHDSYISIVEALNHASFESGTNLKVKWIDSDSLTKKDPANVLSDCNGLIIPGGFGIRGIEGMVRACQYARVNNIPLLGICLGMQVIVIEYARNVLNLEGADSQEFNPDCKEPVITALDDFDKKTKGATMRLGSYVCEIKPGTLMKKIYGEDRISERHRHRYGLNRKYWPLFEEKGLVISSVSTDGHVAESVELESDKHKFFIGVQFHPEFKSRPGNPEKIFLELVRAGIMM